MIEYELREVKHQITPSEYRYWSDLLESGLLRYRLPNHEDPGMADVELMVYEMGNQCYMIYEKGQDVPVGEVSIGFFQGRSAMIHFSSHPSVFGGPAVAIAKWAIRELFRGGSYPDGSKLMTLIGLTPVTNRLAVRFLRKVGFIEKSVLNNVFILGNDKNRIVDGVLSQITSNDNPR